jgi:hypothetical protein
MKKLLIFTNILFIITIGVTMHSQKNSTDVLAEALAETIYQLGTTDVQYDDPGLSNPYLVGVNQNRFENEILYLPTNQIMHTIHAAEYGMNGEDGLDDSAAMQAIIDHIKTLQGEFVEVIFPEGDFDFIQGSIETNVEQALDLSHLENVLLTGQNTTFYFYGEFMGMTIKQSHHIYFRGINIDWGTTPYSMGTILENDGKTFKVQIHDGYTITNQMEIKGFMEYDKRAFIPRVKGNDIYGDVSYFKLLDDHQIEITFNSKHQVAPNGTLVVMRHYIYEHDAIFIDQSSNIYFENVNMFSVPGMGVRAYSSENLYFNRFNTVLKPGSDRLMTTTADALHMIDCKGDLVITNSIFENNGDDALNVHGMYLVIDAIDDQMLYVSNPRGYNFKPDLGDQIEINDQFTMDVMQTLTVSSVIETATGYVITFNEPLSEDVIEGSLLGNATRTASLVFANNVVRNKRSRGILIQTRSAIVEHNVFANIGDAGILITSDSNDWYESISSKNIQIRHNKFIRNNYSLGGSPGDITSISFGKGNNIASSNVQENITIENNFIANSANSGVAILSAHDVNLKHNLVYNVGLLPKIASYNSGLYFSNADQITIEKNNIVANSSRDFQMVYLGQYVPVDTFAVLNNLGFNYNDLLGDSFSVLQHVYKSHQAFIMGDQSVSDWNGWDHNLAILGISDVNQNEVEVTENDLGVNALKLSYTDEGIYFMFDITDDDMNWLDIDQFWNGDGIELFMSSNTESYDALNVLKLSDETLQIFMNAEFQEVIELRTNASIYEKRDQIQLDFWIKDDQTGYQGEGFIPFDVIPNIKTKIDQGQEISLNFVFSDADASGERIQVSTTSHPVETHKFVPYYMGKIIFKEKDE